MTSSLCACTESKGEERWKERKEGEKENTHTHTHKHNSTQDVSYKNTSPEQHQLGFLKVRKWLSTNLSESLQREIKKDVK